MAKGCQPVETGLVSGIAEDRVTGKRTWQAEGVGWELAHACVDDATRLGYVEVLADERAKTANRGPRGRGSRPSTGIIRAVATGTIRPSL